MRADNIDAAAGDVLSGVAGAPGAVEGTARVVVDPFDAEPLEPGEILVCRFTDPSWAPLFSLAEALVIDIGAAASHGAIVARELGVPCVIGTGDGTRRIRSGDRLRVDGSAGRVEILTRAPIGSTAGDSARRRRTAPRPALPAAGQLAGEHVLHLLGSGDHHRPRGHVQRVPGAEVQAAQVAVAVDGQFASATFTAPYRAGLLVPDCTSRRSNRGGAGRSARREGHRRGRAARPAGHPTGRGDRHRR